MSATDLFDIGLNLAHDSFDHDRAEVMDRAVAAGVTRMLVTGSSVESARRAIELARQWPERLRATAGIHPHHAVDTDPQALQELRRLLCSSEVLAAGEFGLDYFRNFSPREVQLRAFRQQLELAVEIGKPVFLHQRDAHEDFSSVLREFLPQLPGGVAHCFTDTLAAARTYLDMGLHVGITGWICDERRGTALQDLVRYLPLDRLLVETDAPYLLPRDLVPRPSGRRNEPMYLPQIVARLAACRSEPLAAVARATTANALRLFRWPDAVVQTVTAAACSTSRSDSRAACMTLHLDQD